MLCAFRSRTLHFGLRTEITVFSKCSSSSRHPVYFLMLAAEMVSWREPFRNAGWKWCLWNLVWPGFETP